MPRLTATTSDTSKRIVLNTMTRRAADREDVRLALIPQTNIITGDADWRRQVLGHTSTVEHIGNIRVGLGDSTNGRRHNHKGRLWLVHLEPRTKDHARKPVGYGHREQRGDWHPGNWYHKQAQHHTELIPGTLYVVIKIFIRSKLLSHGPAGECHYALNWETTFSPAISYWIASFVILAIRRWPKKLSCFNVGCRSDVIFHCLLSRQLVVLICKIINSI